MDDCPLVVVAGQVGSGSVGGPRDDLDLGDLRTRVTRCAPRAELKPELQHQVSRKVGGFQLLG